VSFRTSTLLLLIPVILLGVWSIRASLTMKRRLRPLLSRPCTGRAWKRRFPSASARDIRAFLHVFCTAFTFPRSRALSFLPEDRLGDIYHAQNPPEYGLPDSESLEVFAEQLAATYGLELRSFWRDDLTLGDVFARIHAKA
jgi:hypothetical protein